MTSPVPSTSPAVHAFLADAETALTARLDQFGVSLPENGVHQVVAAWLDDTAGPNGPEIYVVDRDPADMAEELAAYMLSQIAEERPGTDPFAHEATIPLPLSVAYRLIQSMSIAAQISLENDDPDRAHGLLSAISAVSGRATNALLTGAAIDGAIDVSGPNGTVAAFDGPLVLLPQPGLAYITRMLTAVADGLADGDYESGQDDETVVRLVRALASDAAGIRAFTRQFGIDPNPTDRS